MKFFLHFLRSTLNDQVLRLGFRVINYLILLLERPGFDFRFCCLIFYIIFPVEINILISVFHKMMKIQKII